MNLSSLSDDGAAINKAFEGCSLDRWYRWISRRGQEDRFLILAFYDSDRVLGYEIMQDVSFYPISRTARILYAFLEPDFRKSTEVETKVKAFRMMMEWAKERGVRSINIAPFSRSAANSAALFGFKEMGTIPMTMRVQND
jgi:hypothetical protein